MGVWLFGRRGRRRRTRSATVSVGATRDHHRVQNQVRRQMLGGLLLQAWGRLVRCRRGEHIPNRRRARWLDGFWHARCQGCGVALRRLGKGTWVIDARSD
jgi:hypothetical protein